LLKTNQTSTPFQWRSFNLDRVSDGDRVKETPSQVLLCDLPMLHDELQDHCLGLRAPLPGNQVDEQVTFVRAQRVVLLADAGEGIAAQWQKVLSLQGINQATQLMHALSSVSVVCVSNLLLQSVYIWPRIFLICPCTFVDKLGYNISHMHVLNMSMLRFFIFTFQYTSFVLHQPIRARECF